MACILFTFFLSTLRRVSLKKCEWCCKAANSEGSAVLFSVDIQQPFTKDQILTCCDLRFKVYGSAKNICAYLIIDKFHLCGISRTKRFLMKCQWIIYTKKKTFLSFRYNGEKYFINAIREWKIYQTIKI